MRVLPIIVRFRVYGPVYQNALGAALSHELADSMEGPAHIESKAWRRSGEMLGEVKEGDAVAGKEGKTTRHVSVPLMHRQQLGSSTTGSLPPRRLDASPDIFVGVGNLICIPDEASQRLTFGSRCEFDGQWYARLLGRFRHAPIPPYMPIG